MSEDEKRREEESDLAQVRAAGEKLREYFDSVQIFVTRYEPNQDGGTTNVNYGTGNWFTRFGQVREWVTRVEEDTRIERRKRDES